MLEHRHVQARGAFEPTGSYSKRFRAISAGTQCYILGPRSDSLGKVILNRSSAGIGAGLPRSKVVGPNESASVVRMPPMS